MTAPVLLARFSNEWDCAKAIRRLPAGEMDILMPYPAERVDGLRASVIPLIALVAGLAGFVFSLLLQIYADTVSYPLDIGGRPLNSWLAFIPTAFENGILCVVAAGFIYFLFRMLRTRGGLPAGIAPPGIDPHVEGALRDGFYIVLQPAEGAAFAYACTILEQAGAELTEFPP